MTATATDKITEMLQENTGQHLLDSGGVYGRHWQRNQEVDFEAIPEGTLEFWNRNGELEISATLSIYHFLRDRLEYNPELDEQYREFADEDFHLLSAEDFAESIDGRGIYGDGGPMTVNTCNGEDMLSQVIQYVYWTDEDDAHVLLQIHGGCDVRGGYTDPVAFDVEETDIFDNARATIYCDDCHKHWDCNDDYHWAPDGCYGQGCTPLNEYPATEERPEYPVPDDPAQLNLFNDERKTPDVGVIWVEEGNGHCPHCGGLLHVAPFPAC